MTEIAEPDLGPCALRIERPEAEERPEPAELRNSREYDDAGGDRPGSDCVRQTMAPSEQRPNRSGG